MTRTHPLGVALALGWWTDEGEAKGNPTRHSTLESQSHLDQGNGKSHSDRSQVIGVLIGGKLLIGQLAPWVTWDILVVLICGISDFTTKEV